jgi:hypothetical protein
MFNSLAFCVKNYIASTDLLLAVAPPLPSYSHIFPSGQPAILFAGLMALVTFDKDKLNGLTENRIFVGGGEYNNSHNGRKFRAPQSPPPTGLLAAASV